MIKTKWHSFFGGVIRVWNFVKKWTLVIGRFLKKYALIIGRFLKKCALAVGRFLKKCALAIGRFLKKCALAIENSCRRCCQGFRNPPQQEKINNPKPPRPSGACFKIGERTEHARLRIVTLPTAPGVRVSLFVSGCTHHCPGCFNQVAWDFDYGKPFTQETIDQILTMLKPGYIKGLTLLGGEPFEPQNQPAVVELLRQINAKYPEKSIWAFSGYLFDRDILAQRLGPWEITGNI